MVTHLQINGDGTDYINLLHSYYVVDVKVTKADGSNLDAEAAVAPVNLLASSLFSQVDVKLGDTLVSESNNLYHMRAMIETLLGHGLDSKSSQLGMAGYHKDTAGQMDTITDLNLGFKKRKDLTKESQVLQLRGRVHSDIFNQSRYILNGVDMNLKFIQNTNSMLLMAGDGSDFKLKITNMSFFVRKMKLLSTIQLRHIEKLDKDNVMAIYPIRKVETKTFTVSTGSLSANKEGVYTGILPKRILIGAVSSSAFEGDQLYRYKW